MLSIEVEKFVNDMYAKKLKEDQIKALEDVMWIEVQALKDGTDKDKWTKIVERKNAFYAEKENILTVAKDE